MTINITTETKVKRGRPTKDENLKGVNICITIPAGIVKMIDKMAEDNYQSRNECLRRIIIDSVLTRKSA